MGGHSYPSKKLFRKRTRQLPIGLCHLPPSTQTTIRNLPRFVAERIAFLLAFLLDAFFIAGEILVSGREQGENDHKGNEAI